MTPDPDQRAPVVLQDLLIGMIESSDPLTVTITGLHHDSRLIKPGDVFIALNGLHAHGLQFAADALQLGASAILYDPQGAGPLEGQVAFSVPFIPIPKLDERLGLIADRFFGHPSRAMRVIGITGTNGKTSCSHFIAQALGMADRAAVIGTLGWGVPGALESTRHTTPDAIEVHRILDQLRHEGTHVVAMEASSHGLVQGRLGGVCFQGALFTNWSRDHLDYHQTMAAYLEAKLRLLDAEGLGFVVFNAEEAFAKAIMQRAPAQAQRIGFCSEFYEAGLEGPLLRFGGIEQGPDGLRFKLQFGAEAGWLSPQLYGDFNVENVAATVAVLLALGLPFDVALSRASLLKAVPGRMENLKGRGRHVVIDYAHTPDALGSVLSSMKRHGKGRLWVVFGCGGDRDQGKRPQMGRVAEQWADAIVLTDDNPRSEEGGDIIRDIAAGMNAAPLKVIRDRRQAIYAALDLARDGDLVLVAGKGDEGTQDIGGMKTPFSDRMVILDWMAQEAPPGVSPSMNNNKRRSQGSGF